MRAQFTKYGPKQSRTERTLQIRSARLPAQLGVSWQTYSSLSSQEQKMSKQITHQPDENGVLRQIVSPETLRQILDADGDDYDRPEHFGPDDEWSVA